MRKHRSNGAEEQGSRNAAGFGRLLPTLHLRRPSAPLPPCSSAPLRRRSAGFTLIELLVAAVIMAGLLGTSLSIWHVSASALKRGREATENLQRQRALLDVLIQTFNTSRFSQENATWYVWETEDNGDEDTVSFVSAHIPVVGGPAQSDAVPQRITLSLEFDVNSELVLLARVKNFLAYDIEGVERTIRLADWVKTFSLRYYDPEADDWFDTWDYEDRMPGGVEITFSMASSKPGQDDVTLSKMLMIPTTAQQQQLGTTPQPTSSGSSTGRSGQPPGQGSQGQGQGAGKGGGGTGGGMGGSGK
ncbi:MAG: prepilin-type N-terminal cleavage/methylation domain-containing protein [Verrucomicrobia bacterium]|nr:prepilin-type N-terminal cleavage/methylation domain-containing protein [Verrucomicrobiota bacterium]